MTTETPPRHGGSDDFGTVAGLKPMTDEHGHTWQVVWDGWAVGFRITHPDGTKKIICVNPSSESDDGYANAFVYIGAPADGQVITSVTPFEKPGTPVEWDAKELLRRAVSGIQAEENEHEPDCACSTEGRCWYNEALALVGDPPIKPEQRPRSSR